jgi:hypothetical protein
MLFFAGLLAIGATQPCYAQTVVGTLTRASFQPTAVAVYEGANKVFVADDVFKNIHVYNGATNTELESVAHGLPGVTQMVVDEASGKLFMSCVCTDTRVAVINGNDNSLLDYISAGKYARLAKDQSINKIYALFEDDIDGALLQIDAATGTTVSVPGVIANVDSAIDVNPVTHEIFITTRNQSALFIIDGLTSALTQIPGFDGGPSEIGVNWVSNKAYVPFSTTGEIGIFDRNTNTLTRVPASNDATKFVFNPTTNRMITNVQADGVTSIFDGVDNDVQDLSMKPRATALAVRYATSHVYYAGQDYVGVLHDPTLSVNVISTASTSSSSPVVQAIAINQMTGRVYVINDGLSYPHVTVIQDTADSLRPCSWWLDFYVFTVRSPSFSIVVGPFLIPSPSNSAGCTPTVTTGSPWLSATYEPGLSAVVFIVQPSSSGGASSGTISAGDQTLTVILAGPPPIRRRGQITSQ